MGLFLPLKNKYYVAADLYREQLTSPWFDHIRMIYINTIIKHLDTIFNMQWQTLPSFLSFFLFLFLFYILYFASNQDRGGIFFNNIQVQ